jgi:hypothetical protein
MYDQLHKFDKESSQIVRYVYFKSMVRAEQDLAPLKSRTSTLGEGGRGFFDAIRGICTAAKEKDKSSLFVKLYRGSSPKDISELSERFKQEAYRPTTDEYERGYLIAWEIALKILSELKENYPDYPLKDEQNAQPSKAEGEEADFEVKPRKKARVKQKAKPREPSDIEG